MKVKGTALITTRNFIKTKFPDGYEKWFNSLPEESKKLYSNAIEATEWYSLIESYIVPVKYMIKLFYNGDEKLGGDDLGRYSADMALKGFYKVFLIVASPKYLVSRASKIFSTFYDPSEISVEDNSENSKILKITKFEDMDRTLEFRIAGWIKRALEMTNCNNPEYSFIKSMASGDSSTDIRFSWS